MSIMEDMTNANPIETPDSAAASSEAVRSTHPRSLSRIELWHAPAAPNTPGLIESFCLRWLPPDEHESAAKFRVAAARHQHVIGRGMARFLMAGTDWSPNQIQFRHLDHGKPIVDEPVQIRRPFNIAHTRGLVLCGLGPTSADEWLGVDVECLTRKTDPGLADRYFAPEEIQQLAAVKNQAAKQALFLRIWTLKEAFIKAIGTGLNTPLDQFAFDNVNSPTPTLILKDKSLAQGRQWQIRSLTPRPGFIAAVAVGTVVPNVVPRVELLDFQKRVREM